MPTVKYHIGEVTRAERREMFDNDFAYYCDQSTAYPEDSRASWVFEHLAHKYGTLYALWRSLVG